jgi:tRNA A-37 threonylcarbamoyl transferase component Bud32
VTAPRDSSAGPDERARRRRFGQYLGRYRLGTLLGAGGSSSVYLARLEGPHAFSRLVALKVIHEHLLLDREFVSMLLDEATLTARLSHPAIAHTYELGQTDGVPFIAMEYLSGQALSRLYGRAIEEGRPFSYQLVAWIGACAARALHHAHELRDMDGTPLGIVHRDVSPDNLFATRDGQIKVLDFGIATARRRRTSTNLGEIKGKFRYMAPEYTLGEGVDRRLDVFALGATLYELALGVPAFDGADGGAVAEQVLAGALKDPRELRPDFPDGLARCLKRAMAADAAARFQTAEAFALELEALGLARAPGGDPGTELGALVRELFAGELEREAASVVELAALPHASVGEIVTDTTQVVATRKTAVGSRGLVLAAVLVVAAIAVAILVPRPSREPPATDGRQGALPVPPPPPASPASQGFSANGGGLREPAAILPPSTVAASSAAKSTSASAPTAAPRLKRAPATAGRGGAGAAGNGLISDYPFP